MNPSWHHVLRAHKIYVTSTMRLLEVKQLLSIEYRGRLIQPWFELNSMPYTRRQLPKTNSQKMIISFFVTLLNSGICGNFITVPPGEHLKEL